MFVGAFFFYPWKKYSCCGWQSRRHILSRRRRQISGAVSLASQVGKKNWIFPFTVRGRLKRKNSGKSASAVFYYFERPLFFYSFFGGLFSKPYFHPPFFNFVDIFRPKSEICLKFLSVFVCALFPLCFFFFWGALISVFALRAIFSRPLFAHLFFHSRPPFYLT